MPHCDEERARVRTGDVTIKHVGGLCTVFAQAQEGVETGNGACVNASSHAQILYDAACALPPTHARAVIGGLVTVYLPIV